MNLVLEGHGKTGSVVAEMARERGHSIRVIEQEENANGAALTTESLAGVDAVIDFTAPEAVIGNIEACARAGANMVVGTTGWYGEIPRVQQLINQSGTGFVYASNFSIGVNVFFKIAAAASAALKHGYTGSIMERHHVHKKDAPSGTAVTVPQNLEKGGGTGVEIGSVRVGGAGGLPGILLDFGGGSIPVTPVAK